MAIESSILTNMKDILETDPVTSTWLTSVEFENIKLNLTDWQDHALPACQFFDGGQTLTHQQGRLWVEWTIIVELVFKSSSALEVNQGYVLDRRHEVERAFGAKVSLNINNQMLHLAYNGNVTDLHSNQPFFVTQMEYTALFYKVYTHDC